MNRPAGSPELAARELELEQTERAAPGLVRGRYIRAGPLGGRHHDCWKSMRPRAYSSSYTRATSFAAANWTLTRISLDGPRARRYVCRLHAGAYRLSREEGSLT